MRLDRNSNSAWFAMAQTIALTVVCIFCGESAVAAQADGGIKPGAKVCVTGPEVALRSGNRRIPVGGEFLTFHVRKVVDGWVNLASDRTTGWAKRDEVMPFEKAESHFEGVLEKDAGLAWARRWLAALRLERGETAAALADLETIVRLDAADVPALVLKGQALTEKGDFDAAIADLDKAVTLAPSNTRALLARAQARLGKMQLEKAEADFSEALRLDPNDVEAHITRGVVHREQGRIDEAIADFDTAVNLAPQNLAAFVERAIARREKGQLDWALADLNEAVSIDPASAEAFRNLSVVRFELRDFSGALDAAETSAKLAPADAAALNHLAWVLSTAPVADLRDGRKAVEFARKADEILGGKDADAKDTLAAALAEDGQFEEARKVLSKAIELYPLDDTDLPEARKRLKLYENKQAFRADP